MVHRVVAYSAQPLRTLRSPETPTGVHRPGPDLCPSRRSVPRLPRVDNTENDRNAIQREGDLAEDLKTPSESTSES